MRQIEGLYHSALEREPGQRAVFLAQAVHVTVLLNFFDELRRRLPPGGK